MLSQNIFKLSPIWHKYDSSEPPHFGLWLGQVQIYWKLPQWFKRKTLSSSPLTTTDREMSGGGCGSVKYSPVQKVNGRLSIDDLEDLTEE